MKNIWKITFLAIVCIILFVPTLGNAVQAHIWLNSVDKFPDDADGYITEETDFTLYIANEAKFDADTLRLIISLPGRQEGNEPTDSVTMDGETYNDWDWGIPQATKVNGDIYNMPPSDCFPTYYMFCDINSGIFSEELMKVQVEISGTPPMRFDAWGLNDDNRIILKNPFSHNITQVPEFSTIALPIAAIIGIMFILQSRRKKED